ncbi:DNA photolyase FAD-binding protein, partial [bacterium]
ERHPEVWTHYVRTRDEEGAALSLEQRHRVEQIEAGESGCEPMDNFARELVETGYLHNHARMWFAAYWIHTERLPWQLGADFFDRHLICSCPASNTLSWRWVAGLHTQGKSYLARRSNLEKYSDPAYLGAEVGMDRLKDVAPAIVPNEPPFSTIDPDFQLEIGEVRGKVGLWITEDDLSPETSKELREATFDAICTSVVSAPPQSENSNGLRRAYRLSGAKDAAERAKAHWGVEAANIEASAAKELANQLGEWAKAAQLKTVVTLKPFVGPMNEALSEIRARLQSEGIDLVLLRRPEDAELLPYATAGFFKFWQGVKASSGRDFH